MNTTPSKSIPLPLHLVNPLLTSFPMDAVAQMEFFEEVESSVKDRKRRSLLKAMREFQELSREHGGLVSPNQAAVLLGVSNQRVHQLLKEGQLTRVEHLDHSWVSVNECRLRVAADSQRGRPWKKPTIFQSLKAGYDSLKD